MQAVSWHDGPQLNNDNASCAALQAFERALLQQFSKNPYQRALLLTQVAAYHPSSDRQAAALQVSSTSRISRVLLCCR